MNVPTTNNNCDEIKISRDIRCHRRAILKEHPCMPIDTATLLATKRAHASEDTTATKGTTNSDNKNTKSVESKTLETKIDESIKKPHVSWNEPVETTSSCVIETTKALVETVSSAATDPQKPEAPKQQETLQEASSAELTLISVEKAQRLGEYIKETTRSFVWSNVQVACVASIVSVVEQVVRAGPFLAAEESPPGPSVDLIVEAIGLKNALHVMLWVFIGLIGMCVGLYALHTVLFPELCRFCFPDPYYYEDVPREQQEPPKPCDGKWTASALVYLFAGHTAIDGWPVALVHTCLYVAVYAKAATHQDSLLNIARRGERGIGNGNVKMGEVEQLAIQTEKECKYVYWVLAMLTVGWSVARALYVSFPLIH